MALPKWVSFTTSYTMIRRRLLLTYWSQTHYFICLFILFICYYARYYIEQYITFCGDQNGQNTRIKGGRYVRQRKTSRIKGPSARARSSPLPEQGAPTHGCQEITFTVIVVITLVISITISSIINLVSINHFNTPARVRYTHWDPIPDNTKWGPIRIPGWEIMEWSIDFEHRLLDLT